MITSLFTVAVLVVMYRTHTQVCCSNPLPPYLFCFDTLFAGNGGYEDDVFWQ